jgi:hypothetical protein
VAFFLNAFLWKKFACFLVENCTLAENENIYTIFTKNGTFLCTRRRFLKKATIKKCVRPLFSDSTYFSDAKTIFEMFGMISFGVDSQTHTVQGQLE